MNTNSLSDDSHRQFKQKHQQLSELTEKVDIFMQSYSHSHKSNNNVDHHNKMKANIRAKLMVLRDGLQNVKQDFVLLKEDMTTYSGLSTQVIRMAADMPQVYQTTWSKIYNQLKTKLDDKNKQCEQLKNELSTKQDQINKLKIKLHRKQLKQQFNLSQNLSSMSLYNPSKYQQLNNGFNSSKQQVNISDELYPKQKQNEQVKSQPDYHFLHQDAKTNIAHNFNKRNSAPVTQIISVNKQFRSNEQNYSQFDDYINSMEITIRETEGALFRKITQQGSLEQQEESQEDSMSFQCQNRNKNKTARANLILDCLDKDNSNIDRNQSLRQHKRTKKLQSSYMRDEQIPKSNKMALKSNTNANPSEDVLNKHIFWNKLSKNIRNPSTRSQNKRTSLSQSKQNIDNRDHNSNKLSGIDRKILTSKITDFRKILFAQKGIQRLAFKL